MTRPLLILLIIIFFAATLLWGVAATAQQTVPHFAMSHSSNGTSYVYTDDGRSFEVDGDVLDLGMDGETVWTLTKTQPKYLK